MKANIRERRITYLHDRLAVGQAANTTVRNQTLPQATAQAQGKHDGAFLLQIGKPDSARLGTPPGSWT